jgi:hypothetical protein
MESLNLSTTLFCFIPKDKTINKVIISRLKCGSRFLQQSGIFDFIPFNINNLEKLKNADKIYWIIREPQEHFISALITELNSKVRSTKNLYKTNSKIKIKSNDEKFIYELFIQLLKEISTEPFFVGNETNPFSHYYPIYNNLYELIQEKYTIFYKISFINLSELSLLINRVFNKIIPYETGNYSFTKLQDTFGNDITPNWYNKIGIYELLNSNECIDYWGKIKKIIANDQMAYTQLINFNFSDFLIKKIDELHNKLELNEVKHNKNYLDIITKMHTALKINEL